MSLSKIITGKKIIFLIVIIMFIILDALIISFGSRNSRLQTKIKDLQANYEKAAQEAVEFKNKYAKIEQDYAKSKNDFEAISSDRESMRIQIRGLLGDRARARELEGTVEKDKQDSETIKKEKQVIIEQNSELKNTIKKLELLYERTIKEKEQLAAELAKERDTSLLRRTEQEKANLKKENDTLNNNLKQVTLKAHTLEEEVDKLKKELNVSRDQTAELTSRLDKLNKNYALAVEKNKALEQKVVEEPKKFAEIARQNKILIKQTANMHYNMGVFYTKHKEYSRAIAEFERAIELNPNDAYSHFNLGYIYAEYVVDRPQAVEHFQHYLRNAKKDDKDVDWVKKYLLTWESWGGKKPME